jgi:hypothetical protein
VLDDLTREHGADYRGAGVLRGLVDDFEDGSWTQFKQDTAIVEATIPGSDSSCTHRAKLEVDFGVVCSLCSEQLGRQIERHLTPQPKIASWPLQSCIGPPAGEGGEGRTAWSAVG